MSPPNNAVARLGTTHVETPSSPHLLMYLIAELVVDQRLGAERPQVHGLVEPHAVVVHVNLEWNKIKKAAQFQTQQTRALECTLSSQGWGGAGQARP